MKKDGIKKSSIFTKGMVVLTAVSMLGMTGCSNIAVNKPEQDQELSSENTDHNDAVDEQNDTKNSAKIKWEEIGAENKEDKKTSKQDDSDSTEVDEILEELSSGSSEMLSEDEMELLYDSVVEVEDSDLIGEWNRTDCHMGTEGSIEIEEVDSKTVHVTGYFDHYGNSGDLDADGYYISPNQIFVHDQEFDAVFILQMPDDDNELWVTQHGIGCMGVGATANGIYTQDEPVYNNANDITDNFSEDELEIITDLLDEESLDYEEYFEDAILYGSFEIDYDSAAFEDGTEKDGVWYEAFAPHGYTKNLLIFSSEDGEIYMESSMNGSSESMIFMTSDSSVTQMPER